MSRVDPVFSNHTASNAFSFGVGAARMPHGIKRPATGAVRPLSDFEEGTLADLSLIVINARRGGALYPEDCPIFGS
jgi:hypothetical protein